MKYRLKGTFEATQWFRGDKFPGLIEAGRFGWLDYTFVCSGDFIVINESGEIVIISPNEFNILYEEV